MFSQINIFNNHKEEEHSRVFICPIHCCSTQRSPLHLVRLTYCKQRMGKCLPHHRQWPRCPTGILFCPRLSFLNFNKGKGQSFQTSLVSFDTSRSQNFFCLSFKNKSVKMVMHRVCDNNSMT